MSIVAVKKAEINTALTEQINHAERMRSNDLKIFTDFEPPVVSWQGDVGLVAIKRLPASAKPRANRQVAEGNTQGSRHIMETGEIFDCSVEEVIEEILQATKTPRNPEGVRLGPLYVGPVMRSTVENPVYLSHPEHGHQKFVCNTIIAIVWQRSVDIDEREIRMRD